MRGEHILERFEMYWTKMFSKVVDYEYDGRFRITATLDDGRRVVYDDTDTSTRYLPNMSTMTDEECLYDFSDRLKYMMLLKGITQEELSERTGIQRTALSRYSTAKVCPSYCVFDRIVRALDCSADDLRYIDRPERRQKIDV